MTIDGTASVELIDYYVIRCYMQQTQNGAVLKHDSGLHNAYDTFALYGGFDYEHRNLAVMWLVDY